MLFAIYSADNNNEVGEGYNQEGRHGRKGSVVGEQYQNRIRLPKDGGPPPEKPPTNEEVAKAVQQKVAVSRGIRYWPAAGLI